ncbi:MAG: PAS domain-containing hybrid sensor histidine kinase/response regulator, partial [Bacteroidetes bacterium]
MTNPLLERQLKRLRRRSPDGEIDMDQLLELVATTYEELDQERKLKDRSLSLMSEEMLAMNDQLRRQTDAYVEQMMASVVDGIFSVDLEGRIQACNSAAAEIYGYQAGQLSGLDIRRLFRNASEAANADWLEADSYVSEGKDLLGVRAGGGTFPIALSISRITIDQQSFRLFIFRDITLRKAAEEALVQAKEAAEAATQAKSDFLSSMSHEIRTPLNAVIGMADLLMQSHMSPPEDEYVQTIKTSGESLLAIINDILDFSKVEAGKLEMESLPFHLRDSVQASVRMVESMAAKKGLSLSVSLADDLPDHVLGDDLRLRQVLVNLLNNA